MFVQDSPDRLLAALEGELAVRDDCLVLDTGGASYAILWHSSATTWHADENRIEVGGVNAEVGDRVALGGCEGPMQSLDELDWRSAPKAGCLAQDGFWLTWSMEHL